MRLRAEGTKILIAAVVIAAIFVSCSRTPKGVIPKGDMAELLADLHVAEGVTDLNYDKYITDSARMVLKQSVLDKHGVTQADLDSSYMWYGAHLDQYMDVYEDVEKILQKRLDENQSVITANIAATMSGDSVDVWSQSRRAKIGSRTVDRILTFIIERDPNIKAGDYYTWRAKLFNNRQPSYWGITADYNDGTQEVLYQQSGGEGWQQVTFFTDSTRTLRRLYGFMEVVPEAGERAVYIDSIELVRKRVNPHLYVQRYRQRQYDWDE